MGAHRPTRLTATKTREPRSGRRSAWLLVAVYAWLGPVSCAYDYDAPFANTGGMSGTGGSGGSQAGNAGAAVGGSGGDASTVDQAGGSGGDATVFERPPDQVADTPGDKPVEDQAVDATDGNVSDADAGTCPLDHACVPQAPSGWSGPFALRESATSGPTCTGAYDEQAFDLHADLLPAAEATCSKCTCGAVTGKTCRMDMDLYESDNCTGGPCLTIDSPGTWCEDMSCSGSPGLGSIRFDSHTSGTGSCVPSPQNASVDAVSWSAHAVLCAANTLPACSSGNVCLPVVAPPFQPELCIARSGNHACSAPYTQRSDFFEQTTDTRNCTSCTCDTPLGGSCGGSIVLSIPGPTCGGPGIAYPDGSCMPLSPTATSAAILGPLNLTGASCASGGGQPIGSVTPSSRVTVCCLP